MALVFNDRVKELTNTIGTDPYSLGNPVTGFSTFASSFSDGDETAYVCTDGDSYEVGHGTISGSGLLLSRDVIIRSTNANMAVSWPSGLKSILCTASSALMPIYRDTQPSATINPLIVGAEYIDRSTGGVWICSDNTVDANIWKLSGLEDNISETIAMVIALG